MPWICVAVVAVALIYATSAAIDRDYWKDRCKRAEKSLAQDRMDRECIRIVGGNGGAFRRSSGPAVRLYVGREKAVQYDAG